MRAEKCHYALHTATYFASIAGNIFHTCHTVRSGANMGHTTALDSLSQYPYMAERSYRSLHIDLQKKKEKNVPADSIYLCMDLLIPI